MSNFSQFFPAGGGSGGSGGGGINSYAPFKVEATGNPVGYDSTTGVYTNPVDDSIWVKTGDAVLAQQSVYPNASSVHPTPIQTYNQLNTDKSFGTGFYLLRGSTNWTQMVGARRPFDDLYVLGAGTSPYAGSNVFRYEYSATPVYAGYNWEYTGFNINSQTQTGVAVGLAVTSTHIYVGSNVYTAQFVYQYTTAGTYTGVSLDIPSNVPGFVNSEGYMRGLEADSTHIYVLWDGTNGSNAGLAYILKFTHAGTFVSVASITKDFPSSVLGDITFINSTDIMLSYTTLAIQIINATTGVTQPVTTQTSLASISPANGVTLFSSAGADLSRIAGGGSGQTLLTLTFDMVNKQFGDNVAKTSAMGDGQPLFIKLK